MGSFSSTLLFLFFFFSSSLANHHDSLQLKGIDIERLVLDIFYLTIYGSVLGAGSFLLNQFSVFINSILQSFRMSEEMHNPVAIFVLLGIILAGAALGYWIVRRFFISINKSCGTQIREDYYSTFHKTRNRKKFTKKEWDELTNESTKQALAEMVASPEFTDWLMENAYLIKLLPSECSDETTGSGLNCTDVGSGSDSTDVGSGNGFRVFK